MWLMNTGGESVWEGGESWKGRLGCFSERSMCQAKGFEFYSYKKCKVKGERFLWSEEKPEFINYTKAV